MSGMYDEHIKRIIEYNAKGDYEQEPREDGWFLRWKTNEKGTTYSWYGREDSNKTQFMSME